FETRKVMSTIDELKRKIANLKSRMKDECDQLEKLAEQKSNDPDNAETILHDRTNRIQQTFNTSFEEIRQDMKRRKPHRSEQNYEQKERTYVEFVNQLTSPDGPLEQLGNWFKSLFNKLTEIIITIIRWLAEAIVEYVTKKIHDLFKSIMVFFTL
ncbi:unnamed protein product, partial [Didymodactylos carnosus]